MRLEIRNKIRITECPDELAFWIRQKLTFVNPQYASAKKYNKKFWGPRIIKIYSVVENSILVPRGFVVNILEKAKSLGIKVNIIDKTYSTDKNIGLFFNGTLRDYQQRAFNKLIKNRYSTVEIPTGGGKTVLGLAYLAYLNQPTIIMVHTKELMYQWADRAKTFLNTEDGDIGFFGDGKKDFGKKITVAISNSLNKLDTRDLMNKFGLVVIDECHRIPSEKYRGNLLKINSKYILGLSATPYRNDGLDEMIEFCIGPRRVKIDKAELLQKGKLVYADVFIQETKFNTRHDGSSEFHKVMAELTKDKQRNTQICADVYKDYKKHKQPCLVLSRIVEHVKTLYENYKTYNQDTECAYLVGKMSAKKRKENLELIRSGKCKVIFASESLLREGFDLPDLTALFITTHIRYEGSLIQSLGRVLRPSEGNKLRARIYDYCDVDVGVLKNGCLKRIADYRSEDGFDVQNIDFLEEL